MKSITLIALLALTVAPLAAQDNVLDLRLFEVDLDGDRTYHNLIYSRSLGESRLSFEAFSLFLPELDDYDELGVGVGFRAFEIGTISVTLIAYLARAPDDDYFEPALLALDVDGKLTGSLFLLHYSPLGNTGIQQWLVDPAEIQYQIAGPISLGLSGYFYRPQGGDWLRKIGPKISVADRFGATELAIRDVSDDGGTEVQLRRIFVF